MYRRKIRIWKKSICELLVSLAQSVNGAQFLSTTSLSLLFGSAAGGGTGAIVIVPLASICTSLKSYNIDHKIEVLNLIWLLVLYLLHVQSSV